MDFASRNLYRTAVEEMARGSFHSEIDIVQRIITHVSSPNAVATEPGHWLIGLGRPDFENEIGFKPTLLKRLRGSITACGLAGYLGVTFLISLALSALTAGFIWQLGASTWLVGVLFFLGLLPSSEIAFAISNLLIDRLLDTRLSPGLALREGVPEQYRTLVAIPSMLTSSANVEELVERLEVHYLSSGPGELFFALVTDWIDSDTATSSADSALVNKALHGIAELNRHHKTDRFILLHRHRSFDAQQNKWMGWERKRGKLHELNRLLRGASDTNFSVIGGQLPPKVRFVITLDADTRLPRDAARRLVGKMAHPLNFPVFDAVTRKVVAGHGILQPRVTASLPTGHIGSYFQRLYSTARGLDPYVFAASDLYQDLFDEGSFTGKGIYDIDAFELAMAGRIPDDTVLSHDLFEGVLARAGLASDIEVVDEFPEQYEVSAARQHRWTRGDWQLLPWILGLRNTGPIPGVGRWKMIDNLRRSLMPIVQLIALFVGWSLLPVQWAALWTGGIILTMLLPHLLSILVDGFHIPLHSSLRLHSAALWRSFCQAVALTAANFIFLTDQATLMLDAILRTLYRLTVSKKNLLEWTTAAQAKALARPGIWRSYVQMLSAPAIGIIALSLIFLRGASAWWWLTPFAIVWILAPALAHWMSQSKVLEDELAASDIDRQSLRMTARRTWRFFENFVTQEDNMLPPDNFQEEPISAIAHRTSPTNIGLYLLSAVAAREFGWANLSDTIDRIEKTFETVTKIEKFRGHLFNWYDTQTLTPLEPKYVSAVDSGNLAGHLIALANTCETWCVNPFSNSARVGGIKDIVDIIYDEIKEPLTHKRIPKSLRKNVVQHIIELTDTLRKVQNSPELYTVKFSEISALANLVHTSCARLADETSVATKIQIDHWSKILLRTVESHARDTASEAETITSSKARLQKLASQARHIAYAMEFGFLFDTQRNLLSIGYRILEAMRDESCYDMLASEARLASFFAIAKGDLPTRHWFKLGRTVVALRGGAALVSWSGSMFEYLMPSLVMRAPGGGLFDQTTRLIVARQTDYAKKFDVPWGISESAFNARDVHFTYQYSNFGVPGLGLKRGLADNLVIAPYATGLASMVAPRTAVKNYNYLQTVGARGEYGFYEALDYTPARLRPSEIVAIVRAYFAHHQGMTIVAILNAVQNGFMREQFHTEPRIRASELLLQERAPRDVLASMPVEVAHAVQAGKLLPSPPRIVNAFSGNSPATHIMSNGQYSVMITAAGGGYSMWNGLAITRWREDPVCDDWGQFFYLRDARLGTTWSAGHMPSAQIAESYEAAFSEHKAEIVRTDGIWTSTLECIVSSESNAEARRLTVINNGLVARDLEITSFAELVLAPSAADTTHPAFSKLFVETEFVEGINALVATRRKRSPDEPDIWVAQVMLVEGASTSSLQYETDRARFIGRCRDVRSPMALKNAAPLSNTTGTVLDPIFALRHIIRVPRGRQARVTLWTMAASSREAVLDLVDQHSQAAAFERAMMLAWTQAQIQLRHLSIKPDEADLFQELGSHIIYSNATLRPPSFVLLNDIGRQSNLWPQGISGDRPIVIVRIDSIDDIDVVRQMVQAFEYWKSKRLVVDLVILNDRMSSYVQDLQVTLDALVRKIKTPAPPEIAAHVGEIYILRADLVAKETMSVLTASARIVLYARRGSISIQLARLQPSGAAQSVVKPRLQRQSSFAGLPQRDVGNLQFFNGTGGFNQAGSEYIIYPTIENPTPAPWTNIIANPHFGFLTSSDGGGHSWIGNSKEMQLTGWSNDPISNRPSEAIYVMDKATGALSSPTLQPLRDRNGTYKVRHGFGYSVFERSIDDLKMELTQFVPLSDTIKISRLNLSNTGKERRTLVVTSYAEWALGAARSATAAFITTEIDPSTNALIARNQWTPNFENQIAFMDLSGQQKSWTGDRQEFIGNFGSLADPAGLSQGSTLSNRVGAGFDPCAALQTEITIGPGESKTVTITLGGARDLSSAQSLITKYRTENVDNVLHKVKSYWAETLGAVKIKTPDPAFDLMMNGWLLYQTLACRMWARTGFYQASGAYGFRDQLQDSMALLLGRPELTREHILRAAARQFHEGDVQHWWLPSSGTGIRTRFSDDVVWLAYCTAQYVAVTGDDTILEEVLPFIDGPKLRADEHDAYFVPTIYDEQATLFEHCARALGRAQDVGQHGLPLMGAGDWNDGMNRVGVGGQGESIWLGWFLVATLKDFAKIARKRGDVREKEWKTKIKDLTKALEKAGWDGAWYRRAYFDDGTPLGAISNTECSIDAIAQSWSVISGAAQSDRAHSAMAEVDKQLIRKADKVALLFTPPFDKTEHDPGYVKAYPPGVRENGGQYTHGVIWSVFAFAELGQSEKAWDLFSMLNPINHALTAQDAAKYRVEPYVVVADIYSVAPHIGRGGWTWYTGSAGMLYRAGIEAILGIQKQGNLLRVRPLFPQQWDAFEFEMKFDSAHYHLRVRRGETTAGDYPEVKIISNDEITVAMVDDGKTHHLNLVFATRTDSQNEL
ncbi:MAG: glucoamylase family protein [Aestuariivirga sp.]